MANIGNLAVSLTANPSGLISGLNQAAAQLQSFARGVSSTLSSVISPALALPTSVMGFASFAKSGIDEINRSSKEAAKFGISMRSVAAFEVLAGAAGEAMDHGLQHLNATLGEARGGSADAISKFSALGLSMRDLAGLGIDQVYRRVADRLAAIRDPAERAAAAHALFGRTGLELTGILAKGAAGFDQAAKAAEDYGLVVRNPGPAKLATAHIREAELGLQGLKRQLGDALSQAYLKQSILFGVTPRAELFEGGNKAGAEDAGAQAAGAQVARFRESIDQVRKSLDAHMATLGQGASGLQLYTLRTQAANDVQRAMVDSLGLTAARAEAVHDILTAPTAGLNIFEAAESKIASLNDAWKKGALSADEYKQAVAAVQKELGKIQQNAAQQLFAQTRTPIEELQSAVNEIDRLVAKGLNESIAVRAIAQAGERALAASGQPLRLSGAVLPGSQDSGRLFAQLLTPNLSASDRLAALQVETNRKLDEQLKVAQQVRDFLRKQQNPQPAPNF